jgi:hypothetical protein
LFEPYLRTLHLTAFPNTYPFARFHLSHAGPTDVDFLVEVEAQRSDGTSETVSLPTTPLQPLIRLRRFQALANATGTLASGEIGDAATSVLPKAIAGSILRQQGADAGAIRVRSLGLPNLEETTSLADIARAARENTADIYEAQVIVGPSGVELLRKSTTLEVAPIESGPPATGDRPAATPGASQP